MSRIRRRSSILRTNLKVDLALATGAAVLSEQGAPLSLEASLELANAIALAAFEGWRCLD